MRNNIVIFVQLFGRTSRARRLLLREQAAFSPVFLMELDSLFTVYQISLSFATIHCTAYMYKRSLFTPSRDLFFCVGSSHPSRSELATGSLLSMTMPTARPSRIWPWQAQITPQTTAQRTRVSTIPAGKPDGYTASKTVSKTIKMVAPSISAGESVTFKYQVLVLPEAAGTTLRNSVVFTGKDGGRNILTASLIAF